ncbi:MAG: histone deacetylase [Planctomycetota bacterium]
MARPGIIYSEDYYCDIGDHVFRTEKYGLLYRRLIDRDIFSPREVHSPEAASRDQLELVHTPEYVSDLFGARRTPRTVASEMPISEDIVRAFALGAGGSILAARKALLGGSGAINLAGGFHHAYADHAEGFCYINDVAVAVRNMQHKGLAERPMIVDCDLHQGNGTAHIFRNAPEVYTFSIHQQKLYPPKENSDCDVGLPNMCTGDHYLARLRQKLGPALNDHQPDFIVYVAGADPFEKDQLGSLMLTIADLRERDDVVLEACAERDIPFCIMLAGGYAPDVDDTVSIHYNTVLSACEHCE